ncbi:MAG: hypothetical protein NTZ49_04730 [Candidatus Parcubacteria bacterium]|nr:hypothetical protein [Candidatus Parcubacteria bacterium]
MAKGSFLKIFEFSKMTLAQQKVYLKAVGVVSLLRLIEHYVRRAAAAERKEREENFCLKPSDFFMMSEKEQRAYWKKWRKQTDIPSLNKELEEMGSDLRFGI